jgi:hypothetical protein
MSQSFYREIPFCPNGILASLSVWRIVAKSVLVSLSVGASQQILRIFLGLGAFQQDPRYWEYAMTLNP